MSTIGENRLTIYKLLYEHPMCQYIKNQELNVLILGTDCIADEALKASFWCGQYPDSKLHITIAAENASEYISKLQDKLPGLKQFANFDNGCEMVAPAEKTPYADISVMDVSISALQSSGDISRETADKLRIARQNYIFVSLGDDTVNPLVARVLSEEICKNNGTALIHVFNSSEIIGSCDKVKMNYPSIISTDKFTGSRLYRIARNINLVYSLEETGRCSIEEINNRFFESFKEEFSKKAKNYDADSSIASAVHTAYKTAYCGGESQYVQEVQRQDEKYNKLVSLEHRRWVAYMAIQGYRMPEETDLITLLKSYDHRDKKRRLHPCMCDCGDAGVKNRLFSTERTEKKPVNMSELDWISLRRYWALSDEITNNGKKFNDYIEQLQPLYEERNPFATAGILIQAIKMLQNGEDNANEQFRMALDDAKREYPNEKVLEDLEAACNEENGVFNLAKIRNNKVDFFATDKQLIEMLPFCIFFGEKYKTVITVSAGNPLNDVKLPLLMLAETAEFYTQLTGKKRTDYADRLKSFFESRGNNTVIRVESIPQKQPLDAFLKNKIEDLDKEQAGKPQQFIFNIVADMSPESFFAIWQLSDRISAATVTKSGIKAFGVDKTIEANTYPFNLSVDEFLRLDKWKKSPNALPMKHDDVKALEGLFWQTIPTQFNKKYGTNHYDTVWDKMRSLCYGNSDTDKGTEVKNRYDHLKGTIKWDNAHFDVNYKETFPNLRDGIQKKMPEFIRILSEREIIDVRSPETFDKDFNHTEFMIKKDVPFYALSKDSGKFFELLVYYKLKYTGLFSELQTGILIRHSCRDKLENEYDIIAMHKLTPILISCKSTAAWKKEYIYEIASEASVLHGIAVLAIAQDLSTQDNQKGWESFIDRAREWHVSILDASILKEEKKLAEKVGKIIDGGYVYPETAPQK